MHLYLIVMKLHKDFFLHMNNIFCILNSKIQFHPHRHFLRCSYRSCFHSYYLKLFTIFYQRLKSYITLNFIPTKSKKCRYHAKKSLYEQKLLLVCCTIFRKSMCVQKESNKKTVAYISFFKYSLSLNTVLTRGYKSA